MLLLILYSLPKYDRAMKFPWPKNYIYKIDDMLRCVLVSLIEKIVVSE